jgi:hypothetical protein
VDSVIGTTVGTAADDEPEFRLVFALVAAWFTLVVPLALSVVWTPGCEALTVALPVPARLPLLGAKPAGTAMLALVAVPVVTPEEGLAFSPVVTPALAAAAGTDAASLTVDAAETPAPRTLTPAWTPIPALAPPIEGLALTEAAARSTPTEGVGEFGPRLLTTCAWAASTPPEAGAERLSWAVIAARGPPAAVPRSGSSVGAVA